MPWFRLDDSFHSHPKVIAAGNEAAGLFVRCGTYAAEHLTDGYLDRDIVLLYGNPELAAVLVRVRLWHPRRRGWLIHDYLDYNPSREEVERDRKSGAERQRRRRERLLSRRDNAVTNGVSPADPTRPLISGTGSTTPAGRHARSRDETDPADSPAARHPSARPLDQAQAAAGIDPAHHPARDVHYWAAEARRRLDQPDTP